MLVSMFLCVLDLLPCTPLYRTLCLSFLGIFPCTPLYQTLCLSILLVFQSPLDGGIGKSLVWFLGLSRLWHNRLVCEFSRRLVVFPHIETCWIPSRVPEALGFDVALVAHFSPVNFHSPLTSFNHSTSLLGSKFQDVRSGIALDQAILAWLETSPQPNRSSDHQCATG